MKECIFLVEIGTESLPSRILKKLGNDFFCQIISGFKEHNIICNQSSWFASSCRLAVKAKIILSDYFYIHDGLYIDKKDIDITCDKHVTHVYDESVVEYNNYSDIDGNTQTNIFPEKLIFDKNTVIDKNLRNLLYMIISTALEKLNHYDMIRWGDTNVAFIRPVRTVTILLDTYLIPGCFFGVNVDRVLYGNRCMDQYKIILEHADDYPNILVDSGRVIADYAIRKSIIRTEIEKEAKKLEGVVDFQRNGDLLEEVTAQVEWPVVLSGRFDKKFLALPYEIILHILQYDQRYFPVYKNISGMLLPYFIFIANTVSDNYQQIVVGHEKVIKPRLMDAEFFFKNDSKYRLADYISKLSSVLFHRKLGTLRDKSIRIEALSGWIANQIGEDIYQAKRAGYLCKCDLMSNMVYEFPFIQGIIGMYYARRDGELEPIALAQKEHYQPRFANDQLPTARISCVVSIADKIDTISGILGIKELPKGNRDPFALKRSAIGILNILVYKKLSLNLIELIQRSVELYGSRLINETVIDDINSFMYSRLRSWYCTKGYRIDIIRAVLHIGIANVVEIDSKIRAISDFFRLHLEENIKLNSVYKRISNILSQVKMSCHHEEDIQYSLLQAPEEIRLAALMISIEKKLQLLCMQYRFYDALVASVEILNVVNIFFNNVMVMDKDKHIRTNRLILLNKVKNLFLRIVDFSLLQ